jgi:selenocysteine-specific elongation factor
LREVFTRANLESQIASQALQELAQTGQIVNLEEKHVSSEANGSEFAQDDLVLSRGYWEQLAQRILSETGNYHRNFPLRRGLPREELKSRLKDLTHGSTRLFNAAVRRLESEKRLTEAGPLVFLPEHSVRFTAQQQDKIDRLLSRFAAAPFSPPNFKDCQAEVGEDVLAALVDTGQLVAVAPDVVFRQSDYERMVTDVRSIIQERGALTVAEARDHFNTSRRYVLAFLEHLDAIGVTVRMGDERRLKS